jgi:hypothetical protein
MGCTAAAVSVHWIDGYCLLSYTSHEVAAGLQVLIRSGKFIKQRC